MYISDRIRQMSRGVNLNRPDLVSIAEYTANGSGLRKSVRGYFWLLILILTPEGQFLIFSYSSYTRS